MAKKNTVVDPAAVANKRILAQREERIIKKEMAESLDLGLNLKEPQASTAAEFIRDQWDKKTFGDAPKTTTRVVYGPDPIVANCPEFHDRLEKYGQEALAEAFMDLIIQKGESAAPDPIMARGIRASIAKFGKEATARAFRDRILAIPSRTVEVELDGALDPLLDNPMREAVARYGRPGMAVKFLSDRCNTVLGMRGYQVVKDERGDPVKIGTLLMGEIPQEWADRRRLHFAQQSMNAIGEQEQSYYETAAKEIRDSGVSGIAPLTAGESINANPALNDIYSGDSRPTGIRRDAV